jgi:prepilin peptidase CpaA
MTLVSEACLTAASGFLLMACITDLRNYTIPNWISFAIVAFYVPVAVTLPLDIALLHFTAFAVVFIGGFLLFTIGMLGGGDAKLLAAVSLWVGWGIPLFQLVAVVAVFGGILAVLLLGLRTSGVVAVINGYGFQPAVLDPKKGVPYAVAIAGAFFVSVGAFG